MIQMLEGMIRRVCAYGLDLKDSDGFTHDRCTLIPELELSYKTSLDYSTGKDPKMLEKGWSPKLPVDNLKKYLVDIHPAASRFKLLIDKLRHNSNKRMTHTFEYAKKKWYKSHKTTEFKVGDLIIVSNVIFNNIQGPKKFKDFFEGQFFLESLCGTNKVQV
ncbi:hypothetical protein O181_032422 [Austropuccinia psidii MF-1]|uniref:Uncharacterized protein n=1 Tax=Austropuccinia psidii MF-1 TaxID=1389203 RepID=A0A9Q3D2K3_9BASI|nr:hypothetical protein [Austropuccinia psidii MF-1]